jgi:DNA-binding XRE family transcriptional regulator
VIASAIPPRDTDLAGQPAFHPSLREVVAGAVLRAARTSARMTEACLAAAVDVAEMTVRAWEDGTRSLTGVPAPQLEHLKSVLTEAGAEPAIVADLDAAAWCDLVIMAIAGSDDCTHLLADPITWEDAFSDLLAWALTGLVPVRYRRYVLAEQLIADPVLAERITAVIGSIRPDLLPRRP